MDETSLSSIPWPFLTCICTSAILKMMMKNVASWKNLALAQKVFSILWIFFQSLYQIGMKNSVKCWKKMLFHDTINLLWLEFHILCTKSSWNLQNQTHIRLYTLTYIVLYLWWQVSNEWSASSVVQCQSHLMRITKTAIFQRWILWVSCWNLTFHKLEHVR